MYGGASYHHSAYPMTFGCSGCYGYGMPQYVTPMTGDVGVILQQSSLKPTQDKAVVAVKLPADAKLYADGQLTQLTSSERLFHTPTLSAGQRYQYELKVEYSREGKPVSDSKTVYVKAGERTEVEFADKGKIDEKKVSSQVTVLVPSDAKLIVDQTPNELTGSKREFRTPALPQGKEFSYTFRAEIVRDGKKEGQTQVVVFKAGESVKVDFTDLETVKTASK
jgi:uncharacterized protein (TIGR03000 family)